MEYCPYCIKPAGTESICPHCGKNIHAEAVLGQLPIGFLLSGSDRKTYQIGAALGQGGFGITYAALDLDSGKRVAVKEYFPTRCALRTQLQRIVSMTGHDDSYKKGLKSFLDEAIMLSSVGALGSVVSVYDYFENNGTAYLVMEYVDGTPLHVASKNRGGKMSAGELLPMLPALLTDLDTLHKAGVIHRDISPDNLILTPDNKLKLLDFGSARSLATAKEMTVLLKSGFSPIEQYQSSGQGPYTDVYSLASTIYYCLTGVIPPSSVDRLDNDTLILPNAVGAGLDAHQEAAIIAAMAVRPEKRTQSMAALKASLFKSAPAVNDVKIKKQLPKIDLKIVGIVAAVAVLLIAAVLTVPSLLKDSPPSDDTVGGYETEAHDHGMPIEDLYAAATAYYDNGDYEKAFSMFLNAAKAGHIPSMAAVGKCYYYGIGTKQEYSDAYNYLKKAVDGGESSAWITIALCYENGHGAEKDPAKAFDAFCHAAEIGDAFSAYMAGLYCHNGAEVTQDYDKAHEYFLTASAAGIKEADEYLTPETYCLIGNSYLSATGADNEALAFKYHKLAADGGIIESMNAVGDAYSKGRGTAKDPEAGFAWYQKAADAGFGAAMYNIANAYYNGEGVERNYDEGYKYFEKAANAGYSDAEKYLTAEEEYNVARHYDMGDGVTKDDQLAFRYYKSAADGGHSSAMYYTAVMYQNGTGTDRNYELAFDYHTKAYSAGYADSQQYTTAEYMCTVGGYYLSGNGVKKDAVKAISWFQRSGTAEALFHLGEIYMSGNGVKKNYDEGYKYFERSSKAGYKNADKYLTADEQYKIADYYKTGNGVSKDLKLAFKYFKLSADNGNYKAMNAVGDAYTNGHGVDKSKSEAFKWYKKSADKGYALAMYNTANAYYNGSGTDKNYDEAYKYFEKASKAGNKDSDKYLTASEQLKIAGYYSTGNGVSKDQKLAFKYYKLSADNGNTEAMNAVGDAYIDGVGVTKDKSEGFKWYKKAADKGYAPAMYNTADAYCRGIGVTSNYDSSYKYYEKAIDAGYKDTGNTLLHKYYLYAVNYYSDNNYKKAVDWFTKCANHGHDSAMYFLGVCYERGEGVTQNYKKAVEWYTKSANLGNGYAMNNLGVCYHDGKGVTKNYKTAIEWYKKAIDNGSNAAMRNLGYCYEYGLGVTKNYSKALEWYNKAKDAGYSSVSDDIKRLKGKM